MSAPHTPGPWVTHPATAGVYVCGKKDPEHSQIAYVKVTLADYAPAAQEANARLIAAAPELLSALIEAYHVCAVALAWPGSESTRTKMREAIFKATNAFPERPKS